MDDVRSQARGFGGDVEPLNRGLVRKESVRPAPQQAAERFELHDPRSDLTYRTRTFVEMVTKANQIGALQFIAISPEGKRSTVVKTNGVWQPPEAQEPSQPKPVVAPVAVARRTAPVVLTDADAERKARLSQIESALNDRYVIKRAPIQIGDVTIGQTEYRHRGDTSKVAFTESTFRLSTDNNNPSVARSMVDVAEARGWQALRVSGNEDFRRMVWLEASLRNVKTIGYEAVAGDHDLLRKEREARQINRIEPLQGVATAAGTPSPVKKSERGGGGRKAVLAALEAVLVAKNVPERQREAVMAAAAQNLASRLNNGETHRIKIYDKAAPSWRQVVALARNAQRDRDRGAPAR